MSLSHPRRVRRAWCLDGAAAAHDDARVVASRTRLTAFMLALDAHGYDCDVSELAAVCQLTVAGTSLFGPAGAAGRILLLEPDDGPEPDDVLGLVVVPAVGAPGSAVLFTRTRA